jgi:hypothetical protein
MNGPSNGNAARRKSQADQPPDHGGVNGEASAESHPDRQIESRRRWVAENHDRIRDLNRRWRAEHLERARQLNRDSMRRSTARKRREAEVRIRGRERAKRWREAHPDRVRAYQQRWVDENRDKVREYYNRYYANHHDEVSARAAARQDADPERTKQVHKEWADRNREHRAELQRTRRADPDIYQAELAANAAAKRFKRRLSLSGLPPKQLHPVTAAERRTNEREADAYFTDLELPEHLRQFTVFAETLTEHMLKNGARMREFAEAYAATRARMGLPPVPVETIVDARAVELVAERMRRVDLLTSRDVAAAVRAMKAVVWREERQQQFNLLVKSLVTYTHRNLARLLEEATMENLARRQRGKQRRPVEYLVARLAFQEVVHRVSTSRLASADVQSAIHSAKLRVLVAAEGTASFGEHGRPPIG